MLLFVLNIYGLISVIHIWTSSAFVLLAFYQIFRSLKGYLTSAHYTRIDANLEIAYIALLYLGLTLGGIMFFFLHPKNNEIHTIYDAMRFSSLRFWAIEHFSVMLFALIMAQIARFFTSTDIPSKDKFKYSTFYFGMATLTTLISTGMYLLNRT